MLAIDEKGGNAMTFGKKEPRYVDPDFERKWGENPEPIIPEKEQPAGLSRAIAIAIVNLGALLYALYWAFGIEFTQLSAIQQGAASTMKLEHIVFAFVAARLTTAIISPIK